MLEPEEKDKTDYYNTWITSPKVVLLSAFSFVLLVSLFLFSFSFYQNNSLFTWGPPVTLFNHQVNSQLEFYLWLLLYFAHQLINNWTSDVVYPWIINEVQDRKTKRRYYSTGMSLLLINGFNLYSEIDMMLILGGFTSQISFVVMIILANILSSTLINYRYLKTKDDKVEVDNSLLEKGLLSI